VEGLEALRLADEQGLDQETAAARMGVSRPTFSRILAEARHVIAKALVNGWAIRIDGGSYELRPRHRAGRDGRGRQRRGRGGPGNGFS
jgi:predicted DNA-binding protein (UPF0251 family)